jgi:hypothetical protein
VAEVQVDLLLQTAQLVLLILGEAAVVLVVLVTELLAAEMAEMVAPEWLL